MNMKTREKNTKSFSVRTLDKKALKTHTLETMRTSFAIEGIRFTDRQFTALKLRSSLQK